MKKKFSKSWIGSSQTRKQRKYRANAPLHTKRKMMSSTLSKELRKKYEKRSFPIRIGDEIKILVGKFKKKDGKVASVNMIKRKVAIEGIQTKKKDGTKVNVLFDASNLVIEKLNLEDKKRVKSLERKAPAKKEKVEKSQKGNLLTSSPKLGQTKESVKKVETQKKVNKEKENAPN